jgi:hypothetical protein
MTTIQAPGEKFGIPHTYANGVFARYSTRSPRGTFR